MESQPLSLTYTAVLAWAFFVTNLLRVFTYLPTIKKLLSPESTGDGQSQATWFLWIVSNGTFSLHLFELNQRHLNDMVCLNAGNTVMCIVCFWLVRKAQARGEIKMRPPIAMQTSKTTLSSRTLMKQRFDMD